MFSLLVMCNKWVGVVGQGTEDWVKKGEIDVRMQLEEEGVEGWWCITRG